MLLGFDLTSGWGLFASILAGCLLIAGAVREVRAFVGWIRKRFWPEPPEPPLVSIGEQISAHVGYSQEEGEPHRHLSVIRPMYEIRNDGPHYPIKDVTTGVRRRDRPGDHQFDWHAPDIPTLTPRKVEGVDIPPEMFRDVHESVAQEAFVFWARFLAAGGRWEVTRDAQTKQVGERFNPPELVHR